MSNAKKAEELSKAPEIVALAHALSLRSIQEQCDAVVSYVESGSVVNLALLESEVLHRVIHRVALMVVISERIQCDLEVEIAGLKNDLADLSKKLIPEGM